MNNNKTMHEYAWGRLVEMDGFSVQKDGYRTLISAGGFTYDATDKLHSEQLISAYEWLCTRIEARELVKRAKVTIE